MAKYEYVITPFVSMASMNRVMNDWAKDGWELVSHAYAENHYYTLVFRKERQ